MEPPSAVTAPSASQAFRALFEAHAAFVWRVLRRHGVPDRDLEDACQEVFLVVYKRREDFEGRSALRSWVYGIAARVGLAWRRKAYRQKESLVDGPEQSITPSQHEQAEQQQLLALIEQALSKLSPDKREVFALYELEGMTMNEVAAALSVPENTALYRFYGARDEVRSFLERNTTGAGLGASGPTLRRAAR